PDNMVVLSHETIRADWSLNLPPEAAPPFWVLDYLSDFRRRKDYKESFRIYEQELRVPYHLVFHAETKELHVYRHGGVRYEPVPDNERGRLLIFELNLEVGLLNGWACYWHQGELLTPAEAGEQLDRAEYYQMEVIRHRKLAEQYRHRAKKQNPTEQEGRLLAYLEEGLEELW